MSTIHNNKVQDFCTQIKDTRNSDYMAWYKTQVLSIGLVGGMSDEEYNEEYNKDSIDTNATTNVVSSEEQAALFIPLDNRTQVNEDILLDSSDYVEEQIHNGNNDQPTTPFTQLVYAGGSTPEIQQIATDTTRGLRTTLNGLKTVWEAVRLFKHPKGVLLDTIDQASIRNLKTFTFIIFQANRKLDLESDIGITSGTIDRLAFTGKVNSVRAVVEIERVDDRRCKASNIISTNNKNLMDIASTSYLFNINVHKGNPDGYAVISLLKGLGFKIPPISIDGAKSDYLNSLIWFGDHKDDIIRLTQDGDNKNNMMPIFSSRKNYYTRRLKKAVIR